MYSLEYNDYNHIACVEMCNSSLTCYHNNYKNMN